MSGLMKPEDKPDDLMSAMRRIFGPTSSTARTLEQMLNSITEAKLQMVLSTAQMVKMAHDFRASNTQSYSSLVTSPHIDPREQVLAEYEAVLSQRPTDIRTAQAEEQEEASTNSANDDFLARLTQSESSGNSQAEITIEDGRRFVGSLQFGEARLKDYQAATGKQFTQDEFKADKALQDEVAEWHVSMIDKAIDRLGDAAKGFDRDGLRSVAHLGGEGGMAKFVKSGGQYNPSDELGTSLQDYYDKFSNGGAT